MISDQTKVALLTTACQSRPLAYAPYSNYLVGAAVLGDDGQIYSGVNVENASYGLTICAERAAVCKAVTAGVKRILAVAVCTQNGVSPCGACRQVLSEFGDDMPIYISDEMANSRTTTLRALLPDSFGAAQLNR